MSCRNSLPGRTTGAPAGRAVRTPIWKPHDYSQVTGQDRNSVLVDYDIFMNVRRLDAQEVSSLQKLYKAEDFDFRLKPGSTAVDKGTVLPNVTDGFSGRTPDLGALEVGAPVPHYGARPKDLPALALSLTLNSSGTKSLHDREASFELNAPDPSIPTSGAPTKIRTLLWLHGNITAESPCGIEQTV